MDIKQIAEDMAALNREMKFDEAGEKYWSDDVVSIERPAAVPAPPSQGSPS